MAACLNGWLERSARRPPGQSSSLTLRRAARLVPDQRFPGSFNQASGVRQHLDDDAGSRRATQRAADEAASHQQEAWPLGKAQRA